MSIAIFFKFQTISVRRTIAHVGFLRPWSISLGPSHSEKKKKKVVRLLTITESFPVLAVPNGVTDRPICWRCYCMICICLVCIFFMFPLLFPSMWSFAYNVVLNFFFISFSFHFPFVWEKFFLVKPIFVHTIEQPHGWVIQNSKQLKEAIKTMIILCNAFLSLTHSFLPWGSCKKFPPSANILSLAPFFFSLPHTK